MRFVICIEANAFSNGDSIALCLSSAPRRPRADAVNPLSCLRNRGVEDATDLVCRPRLGAVVRADSVAKGPQSSRPSHRSVSRISTADKHRVSNPGLGRGRKARTSNAGAWHFTHSSRRGEWSSPRLSNRQIDDGGAGCQGHIRVPHPLIISESNKRETAEISAKKTTD